MGSRHNKPGVRSKGRRNKRKAKEPTLIRFTAKCSTCGKPFTSFVELAKHKKGCK